MSNRSSDDKLIEGAINGMLASLDPHSGYLDARGFSNLRTQTDGEYGGLGLSVTMEDGVVKVIAPTADTPAAKAGIKAGDYITHINKELIFGLTLDEAVEQMRGKPGTKIDITIVREGQDKPIEMTLTREIIDLKPVKWEVSGDVGVLTVTSFSADATTDLKAAMMAVEKSLGKKPRGWILDLRSNPGGSARRSGRDQRPVPRTRRDCFAARPQKGRYRTLFRRTRRLGTAVRRSSC
jgi:carboxyl-terminal processing protease